MLGIFGGALRFKYHIDRIGLDGIEGWAYNRRNRTPCFIELRTTDRELLASGVTDILRDDLEGRTCGFRLEVDSKKLLDLSPGRFLLFVDGVKVANSYFFMPVDQSLAECEFKYHIDRIGLDGIEGWAYNRRNRKPCFIELRTTDGELLTSGVTDILRNDLEERTCGFRLEVDSQKLLGLSPGRFLLIVDGEQVANSYFFMPVDQSIVERERMELGALIERELMQLGSMIESQLMERQSMAESKLMKSQSVLEHERMKFQSLIERELIERYESLQGLKTDRLEQENEYLTRLVSDFENKVVDQ